MLTSAHGFKMTPALPFGYDVSWGQITASWEAANASEKVNCMMKESSGRYKRSYGYNGLLLQETYL